VNEQPRANELINPGTSAHTAPQHEGPTAFEGNDGEAMFGYPNERFRLDAAMKQAHKATIEHAHDAFRELDHELREQAE
jgi:hypothetical protein